MFIKCLLHLAQSGSFRVKEGKQPGWFNFVYSLLLRLLIRPKVIIYSFCTVDEGEQIMQIKLIVGLSEELWRVHSKLLCLEWELAQATDSAFLACGGGEAALEQSNQLANRTCSPESSGDP